MWTLIDDLIEPVGLFNSQWCIFNCKISKLTNLFLTTFVQQISPDKINVAKIKDGLIISFSWSTPLDNSSAAYFMIFLFSLPSGLQLTWTWSPARFSTNKKSWINSWSVISIKRISLLIIFIYMVMNRHGSPISLRITLDLRYISEILCVLHEISHFCAFNALFSFS